MEAVPGPRGPTAIPAWHRQPWFGVRHQSTNDLIGYTQLFRPPNTTAWPSPQEPGWEWAASHRTTVTTMVPAVLNVPQRPPSTFPPGQQTGRRRLVRGHCEPSAGPSRGGIFQHISTSAPDANCHQSLNPGILHCLHSPSFPIQTCSSLVRGKDLQNIVVG